MNCVWCGSMGGFVNRLIALKDGEGGAIIECEWCARKKNMEANEMVLKIILEERE